MCARAVSLMLLLAAALGAAPGAEDAAHWRRLGQAHLRRVLSTRHNLRHARNVVLFVGDGMGMTTVTAARIFKGQQRGRPGEETTLSFERFPVVGLAKTYNVDRQVPDSAATATALFSGVKVNYYTLGLDATATRDRCDARADAARRLDTLASWAQEAGRHVGLVTTTRLTHATPAALYAHANSRDWECDGAVPADQRSCAKDVARQLVEELPGRNLRVVLGGGARQLGDSEAGDDAVDGCRRRDGRNLAEEWLRLGGGRRRLVRTAQELETLDVSRADYLLGVFAPDHLPYGAERSPQHPSLVNMTAAAIAVLERHAPGFVLVVEAGRIDHAHHDNFARLALQEAVELDQAVAAALELTDPDETLVVVTADHSHAFTVNGYPPRGADVLGFANETEGEPYETLSYANGKGYHTHHHANGSLRRAAELDRAAPRYRHFAGRPLDVETHGGEDVPVYARGPHAHVLAGVYEQSYVAHALGYAACLGPSAELCPPRARLRYRGGARSLAPPGAVLLALLALVALGR
ncbi:alkaline phosphatase 4-like [Bacillus rossius redtenbacheri]|uniref:alkaline phosphatase 4-like n=1 Tax=Bacillus rossius redtenbacheri TaxID=93214 RepID=UPI002FDDEF5A